MPKILRSGNGRTEARLDGGNCLDEPALWSKHRYLAQESSAEPCDCGLSCSVEDRQQVVAQVGNDGKRDPLRERQATISECRGWSKISFSDSDF